MKLRFFALVFVLSACQPKEPADLVLTNGKIVTADETFSIHQTVVVRDGKIVAVGGNDLARSYEATRVVDLGGKMAMPGFNDTHIHVRGQPRRLALRDARESVPQVRDVELAPMVPDREVSERSRHGSPAVVLLAAGGVALDGFRRASGMEQDLISDLGGQLRMRAAREDLQFAVPTRSHRLVLVGAEGFEPSNTGSKDPRLTAWPRPITPGQILIVSGMGAEWQLGFRLSAFGSRLSALGSGLWRVSCPGARHARSPTDLGVPEGRFAGRCRVPVVRHVPADGPVRARVADPAYGRRDCCQDRRGRRTLEPRGLRAP